MVQAPGRVLIAAVSSLVGQAAKCDEGKAAADSSFHLDFSHAVNLKMFGEIQHNIGLEGDAAREETTMDGLHGHGDFAEHSHLVTAEGDFVILQLGHLHSQVPHHVVVPRVEVGVGRCKDKRQPKGLPLTRMMYSFSLL